MKNLLVILVITLSQVGFTNAQKTVGGVTMPAKVKAGETTLNLNGAGVREKYWMDMYACGLYLKDYSSSANEVITSDEHITLKIQIVSGLISSKKMTDAVEEGFENSTGGKTAPLRKKIDQFKLVFSKEEIKKGDVYDIVYVPGKGTIVFKNGMINPAIEGLSFKKALFGIWLGNTPADKDLKKELLGK